MRVGGVLTLFFRRAQRGRQSLWRVRDGEQVLQQQRVQLEPGFVEPIRQHRENLR